MMKILSLIVFVILLSWTWHVVHSSAPIEFETHSDIQQKIANHLIDEFNIALEKLSRDPDFQDKVFYIKLLNTVGKNDWSAEIHPSTKGFESLANKMHDGIMKELKKKIK